MTMAKLKDFEPVTFLNQSGRKIEQETVMVYKDGKTLRIAIDLIQKLPGVAADTAMSFVPFVQTKKKQLVLRYDKSSKNQSKLKTWKSSKKSKSVLISIAGLLQLLGLTEETAPGNYRAEVKGPDLFIYF